MSVPTKKHPAIEAHPLYSYRSIPSQSHPSQHLHMVQEGSVRLHGRTLP